MEAIGIALSAAQTLFASLHCSELKQMCSIFGMESQLNEFQKTVETVKAVLLDADKKDNIPYQKTQFYIKHLKSVVYDADDLLDEFVTLAQQKQHMEGGKASQKLSIFLSRRNPFLVAYKMSKKVKKIRRKLDAIASNHNNFGFSVDSQPIRRRKEETCSYVYDGKVIGREDDVEKIIGLLLDSSKQDDVSFLPIVGIGGLGKTALSQLVFNDVRLTSAFPLMLWTDVADHDQEKLDVNGILRRILASAIGRKDEESTMDRVQSLLREKLERNKYFLVLDDVWTEDRNQWQELEGFLLGGQKGSRIMVTTRSHDTARIIRDDVVYELQGLSKENSWLLFEKIAFKPGQSKVCEDLIHIGREIVEQCSGVPLAIRVAGSLVYGHDKSKWLSFQSIGLFNSREGQKNIMPILKLSYDQLEPPLRSCVTYCAVFPKDFKLKKEFLISLWMAQGFIVPFDEGQRVEDAAEEYFTILLRRCFFQNINLTKFGEIYSCKMHDLMHDMTQKLAGKEVCVTDSAINNIDEEVRHLSFTGAVDEPHTFPQTHIRSYFSITKSTHQDLRMRQQSVEALVANWVCLRVLQLRYMKSLPDSIGNLCHLRFLDVAYNYQLEVLPKSITKLYNLETLKLNYCLYLKELPRDVSKLVKLRILDLEGCKQLNHMLRGLSKLVFLFIN